MQAAGTTSADSVHVTAVAPVIAGHAAGLWPAVRDEGSKANACDSLPYKSQENLQAIYNLGGNEQLALCVSITLHNIPLHVPLATKYPETQLNAWLSVAFEHDTSTALGTAPHAVGTCRV
jgi:hypothetical protein